MALTGPLAGGCSPQVDLFIREDFMPECPPNMAVDFPPEKVTKKEAKEAAMLLWPSLGSHTLSLLPYIIC